MGDTNSQNNEVWITGLGLLSSLGEGPQAHWDALQSGKPANIDSERFAPYPVHALTEPDWSQQISRRDMRQMEPWQQIGTYAAGLALEDAGAKEDESLCGRMDMIVAAGGGERDMEVDASVMKEGRGSNSTDALLAERLSNDLRPTLFLAQLSNLLAGNISIVHKVTGSSRTFMGEEGAGISAIQTAHARIASGQSDIVLVGGAYNAERSDMLLFFALGGYLQEGQHADVWNRDGTILGSVGAFLVMESRAHAEARGAKPYAKLSNVAAEHGRRDEGATNKRLARAFEKLSPKGSTAVLSGASGCADITSTEHSFLENRLSDMPVRGFGNMLGHSLETQFPLGIALAALSMKQGEMFKPMASNEIEATQAADNILVTTIGHHRAEGMALVEPVTNT